MNNWEGDEDRWRSENDPTYPGYQELHPINVPDLGLQFASMGGPDDKKSKMKYKDLYTNTAIYIRATHQYGFRSGQWARILFVDYFNNRPCFVVEFIDGKRDRWPIYDGSDPYEFSEKLAGNP